MVHESDEDSPQDPGRYRSSPASTRHDEALVTKVTTVAEKPPDAGVGLQESQKRSLHLHASGLWRTDGVKVIVEGHEIMVTADQLSVDVLA